MKAHDEIRGFAGQKQDKLLPSEESGKVRHSGKGREINPFEEFTTKTQRTQKRKCNEEVLRNDLIRHVVILANSPAFTNFNCLERLLDSSSHALVKSPNFSRTEMSLLSAARLPRFMGWRFSISRFAHDDSPYPEGVRVNHRRCGNEEKVFLGRRFDSGAANNLHE
jgi:hypothetical protein